MRLILTAILSLSLLGACTSKPVHNFDDQLVPLAESGSRMSLASVEHSILDASRKRGWIARVVEPGLIEAQISIRNHGANVQIPFSADSYSIHYKDSENLDFDDGSIHRNYNKWVNNLSKSIRQELLQKSSQL